MHEIIPTINLALKEKRRQVAALQGGRRLWLGVKGQPNLHLMTGFIQNRQRNSLRMSCSAK